MSEMKYRIADRLFAKELDEAYELGLRYGRWLELSKLRLNLEMYKPKDLTKTQGLGYDRAIEIAEARKDSL
jgi:hypothetical protein